MCVCWAAREDKGAAEAEDGEMGGAWSTVEASLSNERLVDLTLLVVARPGGRGEGYRVHALFSPPRLVYIGTVHLELKGCYG